MKLNLDQKERPKSQWTKLVITMDCCKAIDKKDFKRLTRLLETAKST